VFGSDTARPLQTRPQTGPVHKLSRNVIPELLEKLEAER